MDIRNLVPWSTSRSNLPSSPEGVGSSLINLHKELDQMFDSFFQGFGLPSTPFGGRMVDWSSGWPRIDVADTGKQIKISAELPGADEKDIEVTLEEGALTISGDKKIEEEGPQYSERYHGRFQRTFQLGKDVDPEKVEATFKNGVLCLTIDKKPEAQRVVKHIPLKAA
jgi:HSP20 family protein